MASPEARKILIVKCIENAAAQCCPMLPAAPAVKIILKKKVIESQTQKMFSSEAQKNYRTKRVEKYFSVPKMASPEARKKIYIVKRAKCPRAPFPQIPGS